MCNQSCRTYLWGGTGAATTDGDGVCFCVCDDESWSSLDILGGASCVPVKAHLIFGGAGLAVTVAALCHAAYQLLRQLKFHRQTPSASTSPIEQCRGQLLHVAAIVLHIFSICYFAMVCGNKLRWSVLLWTAIQIPTYVAGAVLPVRMWMYTNNPRLMRKCPKLLAITTWLGTRAGHWVTYGLISVTPVAVLSLELATDMETTFALIASGICVITALGTAAFWICGRSLMRAIDESLGQQHQQLQPFSALGSISSKATNGGVRHARKRSAGDQSLLAARKKVKLILTFVLCMGASTEGSMILGIGSGYGAAAPLILLLAPLAIAAPFWYGVNIQVHAGRSRGETRCGA